jgi:hypothetical protein
MKHRHLLPLLVMLIVAGVAAANAGAAGEPKNQSPFNSRIAMIRIAPEAVGAPDWFERYAAAHPYGIGVQTAMDPRGKVDPHHAALLLNPGRVTSEPKNDSPFNRTTAVDTASAGATASSASHALRTSTASFHWRDAGIGASLATLLLCAAAAGAAYFRPRRPIGA